MHLLPEGIHVISNWYLSIVKYDISMTYFTKRGDPTWNSLLNEVVMADSVNVFKKRLDKFWLLNNFDNLYRAQPLETGSVK